MKAVDANLLEGFSFSTGSADPNVKLVVEDLLALAEDEKV